MADWTLSGVMDGIAAYALSQGIVARAYAFPVGDPQPPCLIVDFPKPLDFDMTYHALGTVGRAKMRFPLWFVVARALDKDARDAISKVISGATGIKDKLDGSGIGSGVDTARVVDAQVEAYTYNGVSYESVRFELEVITTA